MVTDAAYRPRRPEESLLYQVVAGELETFLASQQDNERHVPGFVEKEFRSFLDCGVLARGFLRVACNTCKLDRVVAFSCKSRGICPSCGGRRMADTAAHLVDRVIPDVGFRAASAALSPSYSVLVPASIIPISTYSCWTGYSPGWKKKPRASIPYVRRMTRTSPPWLKPHPVAHRRY